MTGSTWHQSVSAGVTALGSIQSATRMLLLTSVKYISIEPSLALYFLLILFWNLIYLILSNSDWGIH